MEDIDGRDSWKGRQGPAMIKDLVKNFCDYTTIHGVGRLAAAKAFFTRLIWTIFIIGAFSMFIFQIRGLFGLYLSRPVTTVVKVRHKSEVTFPAVTVCNLNIIKEKQIPDNYFQEIRQEIRQWDKEFEGGNEEPSQEGLKDSASEEAPTKSSFDNGTDSPTDDAYYDPEEELRISYLVEDVLIGKLALENYTTLYKMGHKFEDLVFECIYRGVNCRNYSKHWSTFWDYRYGNCYTFNGGIDDEGNNQSVLVSHSTGPSAGLKVNLYIEAAEYVPELSHAAGARVVIHDQREMPFPDDEGLNLVPGMSTSVGVRREIIRRVDPFENGSCVDTTRNGQKETLYSKKFKSSYSREGCMRTCLAHAQLEYCGCAEGKFPIDEGSICNTVQSKETGQCLERLVSKFNEHSLDCETGCAVPCNEVFFKTSMSMAEWPSDGYKDILYNRVDKRKKDSGKPYLTNDTFGRNFLQVRVFFEQLNYQEVREQLSYKGVNLVADIGGQLGLWIGVSVLTCCEVFELMLLIIQRLCKTVAIRSSRTEVRPNNSPTRS